MGGKEEEDFDDILTGDLYFQEKIKSSFNNYVLITSDTRPDIQGVKLHSGFYYHTDDIHEPKVGDMRLQFQLAGLESTSYSVVGQLNESGIVKPFRSRVGHELLILKPGDVSIEEIMSQERFTLNVKSWVTRALGTAILFMALSKLLDVLTKYSEWRGRREQENPRELIVYSLPRRIPRICCESLEASLVPLHEREAVLCDGHLRTPGVARLEPP